ncbi:unnamed protein product [Prorocentrum cordatum]|uniref:Uncharacterized protein n=1 Tax=Prorocentrum cordatum TaxID=2364126 RepID=A0ABN9QQT7_9DINO|nr:unnamed protein product [Polarella glacialis]
MVTRMDPYVVAFLPAPPPRPALSTKKRRLETSTSGSASSAPAPPAPAAVGGAVLTPPPAGCPRQEEGARARNDGEEDRRPAAVPLQVSTFEQYVTWVQAILFEYEPASADAAAETVRGYAGREAELIDMLVVKHIRED